MIDLLAVEGPKPTPVKKRATSYEAATDQLLGVASERQPVTARCQADQAVAGGVAA
jgi:isocitrate dehydrogenase